MPFGEQLTERRVSPRKGTFGSLLQHPFELFPAWQSGGPSHVLSVAPTGASRPPACLTSSPHLGLGVSDLVTVGLATLAPEGGHVQGFSTWPRSVYLSAIELAWYGSWRVDSRFLASQASKAWHIEGFVRGPQRNRTVLASPNDSRCCRMT